VQENNKTELDSLMTRYSQDLNGLKTKKEAEKTAQNAFVVEFTRLEKDVIWPVLVDVGNQLNAYGHDYHVSQDEESVDATAHCRPASITFNIYPATVDRSFYKPESTPYISFVSNQYARKIGITVSTFMPNQGGVIGSHGDFEPSQITKEFVEQEIVNVLKNTMIFHK